MSEYAALWYASPVLRTLGTVLLLGVAYGIAALLLRAVPGTRFSRRDRAAPLPPGFHIAALVGALPLIALVLWFLAAPGPLRSAYLLEQDGEVRLALLYEGRGGRGAYKECAIRVVDAAGESIAFAAWSIPRVKGCSPVAEDGPRWWFRTAPGWFTFRSGLTLVDLWTGEQQVFDDALEPSDLPADGEVELGPPAGSSLTVRLQDGSVRYLAPDGALETTPRPALAGPTPAPLPEPERDVPEAYGVHQVRALPCPGVVTFTELAFGDDLPRFVGGTKDGAIAWRTSFDALDLSEPLLGAAPVGDRCILFSQAGLATVERQGGPPAP